MSTRDLLFRRLQPIRSVEHSTTGRPWCAGPGRTAPDHPAHVYVRAGVLPAIGIGLWVVNKAVMKARGEEDELSGS
ncbi:hypothetical protein [Streptomyces geysiriensis]|uniref:hypothetical protein n=1 Tax=Streptomyces geysiriensis TaxID=68207 RepID=UPI000A9EA0F3|nr:hypothetical protein [Streptomyces geysiriensis]MBX4177846.1 hypothetical protein [Streptomyces geysiriensis]